jgi:ribonuclease HI
VLLVAPTREHLKYVVQMHFPREKVTNNTAEYEGLPAGLRIILDLGIRKLVIHGDSQLVVKQVNKDYQSPLMEAYVEEVRKLEEHFDGLQIEHIPRAENSIADHLSKCAAQKLPVKPGTFVLHLTQPSVTPSMEASKRRKLNTDKYFPAEFPEAAGKKVARDNTVDASEQQPLAEHQVLAVETSTPAPEEMPLVLVIEPQAPAWVWQIVHFLQTGELPNDQEEAEKVARQSSMYQFVDSILHRKRPNREKLKCICREDGLKLLAERHGGICGSHIGSRALVGKAFRQGFYWPTALQDATKLVTKCEAC